MTLVSFTTPMPIGPVLPLPFSAATGSENGTVADAANEGMAAIFIAEASVTIDCIAFKITAFTTSVVMSCSIEALDTSGNPSGTPIGSAVNSASITATGTYEVSGLGAAVTEGTAYAACVRYSSGTSGTIFTRNGAAAYASIPHVSVDVGAGWVKGDEGPFGIPIGIGTSTSAYLPWIGLNGPYTVSDSTYTDASSPDEYGLAFQVPVPLRCRGFMAAMGIATGGTFACVLTDSSGNDVGSTFTGNLDSDLFAAAATEGRAIIPFASKFTLAANTTYVIGIKSTSAGNISLRRATMNAAAQLGSWFSTNWYLASRNGAVNGTGTAWTLTSTEICPFIWPMVDYGHDGAGGGGGGLRIVAPGGLG